MKTQIRAAVDNPDFDDRRRSRRATVTAVSLIAAVSLMPRVAPAQTAAPSERHSLAAAYPDHVARVADGLVHFHDGSSLPFDDGKGVKDFATWLASPDIADMLEKRYVPGPLASPPATGEDPGRARNAAFFNRVYGDCRKGEVSRNLVDVIWLPKKWGGTIRVSKVNGVARRLAAVSRALDALPPSFDRYLKPPAGTYNCRVIAGTDRVSAHGYGIAIDIATARSDYWRWPTPPARGAPVWRNRIPMEIVTIFEAHGFIWGGKWHHYDTMHFEYRPELLPPIAPLDAP